jgi:hypothetical protein
MAHEVRYSEAAIIKEPAPFQAVSGQAQPTLLRKAWRAGTPALSIWRRSNRLQGINPPLEDTAMQYMLLI